MTYKNDKTKVLNIRITPETESRLIELQKRYGTPKSEVVRDVIGIGLDVLEARLAELDVPAGSYRVPEAA